MSDQEDEVKTKRTLMYDVASVVIHLKQANVDEVCGYFPAMTREQVRRALQNASAKGLIHCIHNGQRPGVRGCGPGVYGPRDAKRIGTPPQQPKPAGRVVVSIFDQQGVSIPEAHGMAHSPLGGWQ